MTYGLTALEFLADLGPRGGAQGDGTRSREFGARPVPWAPLSRMLQRLRARLATSPYEPIEPDVIDHPAFRGMSQHELADLPFPRYALADMAETSEAAPTPPAA